MREAAHLPVGPGGLDKVEIRERMRLSRAFREAIGAQGRFSHQMRRLARGAREPQVHVRLAEMNRQELSMAVRHVQQAHAARAWNVVEGIALPREGATRGNGKPRGGRDGERLEEA